MGKILAATRVQRLAFNMLWCALLFWPWKPLLRETVSGFIGRKAKGGSTIAIYIAHFIDGLHPNEIDHCRETADYEEAGRRALYPELYE